MTWLIGDCNLRPITENGYEMVENKHYLAFVEPNSPPDKKNLNIFKIRTINVVILSPEMRYCRFYLD